MQVDHDYVAQCLSDARVDCSASGAHGLLSGLICGGETNFREQLSGEWFLSESGEESAVAACRAVIDDLALAIYANIDGEDFGFPLLLPDENAPLQQRAIAVRDWCDGFLYGTGLVAAKSEAGLPDQIKEALNELSEISRMEVEDISGDEEEEVALTELTEFLWVAAMLVYEEMASEQREKSQE